MGRADKHRGDAEWVVLSRRICVGSRRCRFDDADGARGGGRDRSCCLEELIVALHDIGAVLDRPALARLARIARAAEQVS